MVYWGIRDIEGIRFIGYMGFLEGLVAWSRGHGEAEKR